jgi:hypothetical protein
MLERVTCTTPLNQTAGLFEVDPVILNSKSQCVTKTPRLWLSSNEEKCLHRSEQLMKSWLALSHPH